MEYRRLGSAGLKVSALSLGSWVTYGPQVNTESAAALIKAAYDRGVNFFDNAEAYAAGKSEEIMGAALRRLGLRRESYIVSSKFFWGLNDGPNQKNTLNRKYLMQAVDGSLKRFGFDFIDLVFCHRPDPETPVEEVVWAMSDIVASGKALYWGTSMWSADQIREAWEIADRRGLRKPQMEQPQYNLLDRTKVESEFERLYDGIGLGLTTWSPLASGVLSGKYAKGVPEGTRLSLPGYGWLKDDVLRPESVKAANELKALAAGNRRYGPSARDCLVRPEQARQHRHHRREPIGASRGEPEGHRSPAQAHSRFPRARRRGGQAGDGHRRGLTLEQVPWPERRLGSMELDFSEEWRVSALPKVSRRQCGGRGRSEGPGSFAARELASTLDQDGLPRPGSRRGRRRRGGSCPPPGSRPPGPGAPAVGAALPCFSLARDSSDHVEICGEKGDGLLRGVYDFLEALGARWVAPGEGGERLPRGPKLSIAESLSIGPGISSRRSDDDAIPATLILGHGAYLERWEDYLLWAARAGYASVFIHTTSDALAMGAAPESLYETLRPSIAEAARRLGLGLELGGHGLSALVPRSLFAEEPELFRERGGERLIDRNFCPSSASGTGHRVGGLRRPRGGPSGDIGIPRMARRPPWGRMVLLRRLRRPLSGGPVSQGRARARRRPGRRAPRRGDFLPRLSRYRGHRDGPRADEGRRERSSRPTSSSSGPRACVPGAPR